MDYRNVRDREENSPKGDGRFHDRTKKLGGLNYDGESLESLLRQSERIVEDEIDRIDEQIAEREKIKQRNLKFLEWQRQKIEELICGLPCFNYNFPGTNEPRNKLTTLLIQVELKKGEEYVSAFRDIQRLEEQKRKLLNERAEDEGWSKY